MNYLQRVIGFIENESCVAGLALLGKKLQMAGIGFQCCLGEEIDRAKMVIDYKAALTEGCHRQGEYADALEGEEQNTSILWLTDCAEWARRLLGEGEPVLVILHEGNQQESFEGILYICQKPQELDGEYFDRVYRRYVGIPWDITESDRCVIRETTVEDVDVFWQIYSVPEITQYTEGLYPTVEAEKQYVRDYIEKVYGFYGFGVWTIVEKTTGEVLGRAGFSYREGYEEPELGFVIRADRQREGFAYEVCTALLEYGVEEFGFEKVQAFVMPENIASRRLCEKLGMRGAETVEIQGITYVRYDLEFSAKGL